MPLFVLSMSDLDYFMSGLCFRISDIGFPMFIMGVIYFSVEPHGFEHLVDLFQCGADVSYFFSVVYADCEPCIEDAVVSGNVECFNADVVDVVERFGDAEEHAFLVDTADVDGGLEEMMVDVPCDGDDVVSEVALELHSLRAIAFVNVQAVVFGVYVAQGVVSGDWMAATLDDTLVNVGIGKRKDFFAVDGIDFKTGGCLDFGVLFLRYEWDKLAPSF